MICFISLLLSRYSHVGHMTSVQAYSHDKFTWQVKCLALATVLLGLKAHWHFPQPAGVYIFQHVEISKLAIFYSIHWQRRVRREDPCSDEGCNRPPASTDSAFQRYVNTPMCQGRNIMVCKTCELEQGVNITLTAHMGAFDVWCLDKGRSYS